MIYLACFLISAFFLNLCSKRKRGVLRTTLFMVAVAAPVLLATYRSLNIGIDVRVYIYPYEQWAVNSSSFIGYWSLVVLNSVEWGYALLNYIGANFLGGIGGVFFLIELLVVAPVYVRLLEYKNIPVWLSASLFLFVFYNMSLNLARQSISLSILFFAYEYIKNKKYKRFVLFTIVAILFHYSAVLGISYIVIERLSKGKDRRLRQSVMVGGLLIVIVFYNQLFSAVISVLAPGNADKYLNAFLSNETGYISTWNILFALFFIAAVVGNKKYLEKQECFNNYVLIALFNLILYLLTMYNGNCYRYSLYFLIFIPTAVPLVRYRFTKSSHRMIDMILFMMYLAYWINFNIVTDGYGTIPYETLKM